MYCSQCGTQNGPGVLYCTNCGTRVAPSRAATAPRPAAPPQAQYRQPPPASPGSTYSTVGIVAGAIAFLFLPILFGPAGLILGAIAHSKGEEKAIVALVVSGVGMVVGFMLGAILWGA